MLKHFLSYWSVCWMTEDPHTQHTYQEKRVKSCITEILGFAYQRQLHPILLVFLQT